jgi:hypothetical protein
MQNSPGGSDFDLDRLVALYLRASPDGRPYLRRGLGIRAVGQGRFILTHNRSASSPAVRQASKATRSATSRSTVTDPREVVRLAGEAIQVALRHLE